MNGTVLGDAMMAAGDAYIQGVIAAGGKPDRRAWFRALGAAVVTHVQTTGVVSGTATGVTVGAAAVPVVGAIT